MVLAALATPLHYHITTTHTKHKKPKLFQQLVISNQYKIVLMFFSGTTLK